MKSKIPVFIINLKKRSDRFQYIIKEFENKVEFNPHVLTAVQNDNGAFGLWQSIIRIIQVAKEQDNSFVIVCEDDHQFTKHYSIEKLSKIIKEAQEKQADVLLGGVSWFCDALQVSTNLFWVNQFTGTQFIIVYRQFFDVILSAKFSPGETADQKISTLTSKKFCMCPFISIQKEFGYSDATTKNNTNGYVSLLFNDAIEEFNTLAKISVYYNLIF